jgi:hypothetical protein
MRAFKNRDKTTFGVSERFSTTPDPRPAFYKAFSPLSHTALGRAISPVGTFTTGPKGTCFDVEVNDVPFRTVEHHPAPAHSRGVKRTEARFFQPVDEGSPGPIYKPLDVHETPSVKFNKAPRFRETSADADDGAVPVKRQKLSDFIALARKEVTPAFGAAPSPCSFGIRHRHLEQHAPSASAGLLGPCEPLAQIPPYSGKFGTGERASVKTKPSGPGSAVKVQSFNDTPHWTIGRRRKQPVSTTPGPGAYDIAKFSPVSKPSSSTFSRTCHDGKLFTVLGRDSPGPSLYSERF